MGSKNSSDLSSRVKVFSSIGNSYVGFDCPFCSCLFLTEHDLASHLKAFSDVGEAHKDAVRRLHEFVEEFGS